jgi:hypothetical protein
MQLEFRDDLPFVSLQIGYLGRTLTISDVLVDTGSATSIFAADQVAGINLQPAPDDVLYTIRGIGGSEVAFARIVDFIEMGGKQLSDFEIEVGGMDYGFDIHGILGMDFLTAAHAVIDLNKMEIRF